MNIGTKARNLTYLQSKYPELVPHFEVVPFADIIEDYLAIKKIIEKNINAYLSGTVSEKVLRQKLLKIDRVVTTNGKRAITVNEKIVQQGWERVSFRTSAANEDGEHDSFAGQYESYVDIAYNKRTLQKYSVDCFKSLYSMRVIEYAKNKQMPTLDISGSIVIQLMYYGDHSGVLFTEDGTGNLSFVIADAWKNTIVDGDDGRTVTLSKTTYSGVGSTNELRALAGIGVTLEKQFGQPLDIEWAYKNNSVALLQVRPLTTSTAEYSLNWDNTNISENYPDITLPLTYSFIRKVYARVYPSFFSMLGVKDSTLQRKGYVFDNILGYINGQVYYRIDNWYELVRMIPGQHNQLFFEAMLNPAKKKGAAKHPRPKSAAAVIQVLWLGGRMAWLLLRSERLSKNFTKQFRYKSEQYSALNWQAMSAESSLRHMNEIRSELLSLWAVPILNDIRVMIFHGILKTRFFRDDQTELYLEFLRGLSDKASIKPLEALSQLGNAIATAMKHEKVTTIEQLMKTESRVEITELTKTYIDTYGGRTPDELQLENPRIADSSVSIMQLAYTSRSVVFGTKTSQVKRDSLAHLSISKRMIAKLIAKQTRQAIDHRERFRFNRAQVFSVARQAYMSIGATMHEAGILNTQDDIFWLTEGEIESIVGGHEWDYDARKIVEQRKKKHTLYKKHPRARRVSGHGSIAPLELKDYTETMKATLNGTGVAAGVITGEVIVVRTFDPTLDVSGKILVVTHIDPGWTLLFVKAAGVITERGNALSHVAIIAREIGIPAIVGVQQATVKLFSGQRITIDGISGEVHSED